MNEYDLLLEQIPVQYNLFSLFVFTSIFLGLLIALIILSKKQLDNQALSFLGYGVLCITLTQVDFFLGYTGLMKYVIWLDNFSETLALLIPICVYFFFINLLKQQKIYWKQQWKHFVIPILYFVVQSYFYFQVSDSRLNIYVNAYHSHLNLIPLEATLSSKFPLSNLIVVNFPYLLIAYFIYYIVLCLQLIKDYNTSIQKKMLLSKTQKTTAFKKSRYSIYIISLFIITTLVCIPVYSHTLGNLDEAYLILCPTATLFFLTYIIISKSHFFDNSWLLEKYHTSGLSISTSDILQEIISFVEQEEYYLQKNCSLKDLADQLSLSPNYLSQIINDQTHQNFNDFINYYRIEEVKKRLLDDAYSHLNIAGIGESVGFKSKSSFYVVFKKHTQFTPAAYVKAVKNDLGMKV